MKQYIQKLTNGLQYGKHLLTQKKAKPYEFINWLRFANAGMLNDGNVHGFEYAIEHLPSDNPIIEIGSFCGLSTNLMNFYLERNKKTNKLITCDKWMFEGAEVPESLLEGSKITHKEYKQFVKETYIRNVSFFSKNNLPYTIEEFSDDFFARWNKNEKTTDVMNREIQLGGNISFAYIDGNHTYEYAKRDFENVDKHLDVGGFILFDDSADYYSHFGVNELMQEIKQMSNYSVIMKNPNYLVKKIS